jgi:hypothetical protein
VEIRALDRIDLLQRGAKTDVDAAPTQFAQRVLGETEVDLGQHAVGRLDQHPAHPMEPRPRVPLHRLGGKVLKLGQRLEPCVAATDEDIGEQLVAASGVLGVVGPLQRLDDVVAQPDRVGEALESDRVPVQAGDRQHAGDRAERQQQGVVADLVDLALVVADLNRVRGRIVGGERTEAQIGSAQDVAQRGHHVARLQRPGRRLGQERRVEQEIDVVDQHQARRLARHQPLHLAGRGGAAEPTTRYDDVPGHR